MLLLGDYNSDDKITITTTIDTARKLATLRQSSFLPIVHENEGSTSNRVEFI
jgi:hypothetical protein